MKLRAIAVGVLLLLGLVAGGKLVGFRKDLVAQQEAINGAWDQVDVTLQRRADLVPNLVEPVNAMARQERTVVDSVTKAQAALVGARAPAERIAANSRLDSALARLLVVVENYPKLQSSGDFLRLQDELAGAENRIADERRKYNETVQKYNTSIGLFPNNIAASLFGFSRNDAYFKTDPASRVAPKVAF